MYWKLVGMRLGMDHSLNNIYPTFYQSFQSIQFTKLQLVLELDI